MLEWARAHLAEPLSLDTTVVKWPTAERLARAQQLLETTGLSVERIATEVGFGTALRLRRNFLSQFGTTPSEYRRSFSFGQRAP